MREIEVCKSKCPTSILLFSIPCGLKHDASWNVRQSFGIDYYIQIRWRATFPFHFAKEVGYDYTLSMDDDALIDGKWITKPGISLPAKFTELQIQNGAYF
jgi:hypothetical protein